MPLAAEGSPPQSGAIAESLSKIRELLREFDGGGGESASATGSGPAAAEPREAEPDPSSDGAVATPDPIPAAMPRRHSGIAVAAVAVGGLAVLGTAGLVSAGRLDLPLLVVSTAGQGQADGGNQPKAMARAALPPPRGVAAAPGEVMPGPPAGTREASRQVDSGAWRLPPPLALAERASQFINSYWKKSGARGDVALRYLSSLYAPVINYYGQQRTRDSVLQDKRAFLRRWPIRQTWPVSAAGNPTISCDRARAECEITGVRDFAVESPKWGARSRGVVRYSYKVRFVEGTAQIVAESSKIAAAGAIAVRSRAALLPLR